MSKVIVTKVKDGKKPSKTEINNKITQMIEGAANADGSWKKGWQPSLLQCYIKKDEVGVYTVVHNLERKDYSLSLSPIKVECNYKILWQGALSFTFEARDSEQNLIDIPFRFAMSIIGD